MGDKKESATKEQQVVHFAVRHVGARDRRRNASTRAEKDQAQREEYITGRELDSAVRRLKPT